MSKKVTLNKIDRLATKVSQADERINTGLSLCKETEGELYNALEAFEADKDETKHVAQACKLLAKLNLQLPKLVAAIEKKQDAQQAFDEADAAYEAQQKEQE